MNTKKCYHTTDLCEAATLLAWGYEFEWIDISNPDEAIFYVKRDKSLDDFVKKFTLWEILVDPRDFVQYMIIAEEMILNEEDYRRDQPFSLC